jgi:hypothetical protein
MSSPNHNLPQSFEATVRGQLIIAGDNGYDLHHPKLEAALREQTQIIVAAYQVAIATELEDIMLQGYGLYRSQFNDDTVRSMTLTQALAECFHDRIVALTKKEARDTNEPTN